MTPLLRFDGVTLVRGGRTLFEDLDLQLRGGECVQVAGPNGSGKSSLIRLAAGLLTPSKGHVERTRLSLANDRHSLDPERPLENALRFWGNATTNGMEAFGLSALAAVPVRLLSSGQAKRAALARVAASGAPLWLLDEPLNALDADGAQRLDEAIDRHRASGGAVLAASHQPLPGEWRRLELGR